LKGDDLHSFPEVRNVKLLKPLFLAVATLLIASPVLAEDPGPNQFRKSTVPRACLDNAGQDVMAADGSVWRCDIAKDPDTGAILKSEDVWNAWAKRVIKGKEIFVAMKSFPGYHVKQDTITTEMRSYPVASKEAAVVSKDREVQLPSAKGWQYAR
jgi:hypothetical protein